MRNALNCIWTSNDKFHHLHSTFIHKVKHISFTLRVHPWLVTFLTYIVYSFTVVNFSGLHCMFNHNISQLYYMCNHNCVYFPFILHVHPQLGVFPIYFTCVTTIESISYLYYMCMHYWEQYLLVMKFTSLR